jgi:adenine deaminase
MVNKAISMGLSPVVAIQMATINAARHFRVDHLIGSLTPGRYADIILSKSLEVIDPVSVYFHGKQVAQNSKLAITPPSLKYPDYLYKTINVSKGKNPLDFKVHANGQKVKVWVIELVPDQIINKRNQIELDVKDGFVNNDIPGDILKLAVVERYGKTGGIGVTYVKGFGIKRGAIASSVSHDHHNIVVAGTNDFDMAICVKAIEEMQGGLAIAADGKLLDCLPLPIGGLMSDKSSQEVIESLKRMNQHYRDLGGALLAPFMSLSFNSLPTVPELGLTDKGLIDVHKHELISSFVTNE